MKRKSTKKRLSLNKQTISNLKNDELKLVYGGQSECASACFADNCMTVSGGKWCYYK